MWPGFLDCVCSLQGAEEPDRLADRAASLEQDTGLSTPAAPASHSGPERFISQRRPAPAGVPNATRECLLGRLGLSHPVGLGPSSWAQTELLASHLLLGKVGSGLRGHPSPAPPDPGSPDPRFGVKHLPRRLQRNRLISLVLIFFLKWPEAQKTPCFSHGKHFPASLSVHSLTQPKPID